MQKYNGCKNGPILRSIRQNKNLTVDKVCEIAGISTSTLNQIEQGVYKKVLIAATGALMNTMSSLQKESIPAVSHVMLLERA